MIIIAAQCARVKFNHLTLPLEKCVLAQELILVGDYKLRLTLCVRHVTLTAIIIVLREGVKKNEKN